MVTISVVQSGALNKDESANVIAQLVFSGLTSIVHEGKSLSTLEQMDKNSIELTTVSHLETVGLD
jgi:hypothetical protein